MYVGCKKEEGNKRTLGIDTNPLIIVVLVHRKEYLWYQKPPRHLFILILKKIFPKEHVNVLQDSQTDFSQNGRRQRGAGTRPQIGGRQWTRLGRDARAAAHGRERQSHSLQSSWAYGNHSGAPQTGDIWPVTYAEHRAVHAASGSRISVAHAKWGHMGCNCSLFCCSLAGGDNCSWYPPRWVLSWSLKHWGTFRALRGIWQGVKSQPSLSYINTHIPLMCSFI